MLLRISSPKIFFPRPWGDVRCPTVDLSLVGANRPRIESFMHETFTGHLPNRSVAASYLAGGSHTSFTSLTVNVIAASQRRSSSSLLRLLHLRWMASQRRSSLSLLRLLHLRCACPRTVMTSRKILQGMINFVNRRVACTGSCFYFDRGSWRSLLVLRDRECVRSRMTPPVLATHMLLILPLTA